MKTMLHAKRRLDILSITKLVCLRNLIARHKDDYTIYFCRKNMPSFLMGLHSKSLYAHT